MSLDNDKISIELMYDRYIGNSFDPVNCKANMYVGDCIRDLTKVMKNINTNLEKIANNTRKVEISSVYQNCGPVKLTPKYEGKFYKEGYVDKNIILD